MQRSRKPVVSCPVCQQADQVRTMQAAYEAGELPVAPPPLPESHASLARYLSVGMALVGIAVFLSIVILSTNAFSWMQMILTLACIVAALVLSFLGIHHISQGDEAVRQQYPLWDQAMATWMRLRFCARDHVIFDQQSQEILSPTTLRLLLDLDQLALQHPPLLSSEEATSRPAGAPGARP